MEYQITGRIKVIMDLQTFDSGFTKREFVVTTQEQYPQDVKMELIRDRTNLIEQFNVGDMITTSFNVRGNEYQGRYYVNLQAWRIAAATAAQPEGAPPAPVPMDTLMPDATKEASAEDDLPF